MKNERDAEIAEGFRQLNRMLTYKRDITILCDDTNGDAMEKLFPDLNVDRTVKSGFVLVTFSDGTVKPFTTTWWDAPYFKEVRV